MLVAAIVAGCGGNQASTSGVDTLASVPGIGDSITPGVAAPRSGTLPTSEPSIAGAITAVEGIRIRVETDPRSPSGSPKASVRVDSTATILRRSGELARLEDLKLGSRVSVWFDGPVMESYPVQAIAGTIVVEPDSL